MDVKITADHVFVKTPYDHRDYVKDVLNGVYSKREKMNRFPKNINAMRELMKVYPILKVNPKFQAAGQKLSIAQGQLLAIKGKQDADGDERLRPYQRVDVEYLAKIPSAGIFNEPRTGKTLTSIMLIKRLRAKRNLVIAPASLIWNWAAEFERWLPSMKVFVWAGTPKQRSDMHLEYVHYRNHSKPHVLIISKDTWKREIVRWQDYEWDTLFVDEAHYLRTYRPGFKSDGEGGRKPKGSQQALAVIQAGQQAKHRYALTGTPTIKDGTDIWGILHFLYPDKFKSFWQFAERYFTVFEDFTIGGVKPHREKELQELIGFISVQRKRKEVMAWLPAKQHIPFYVKMNAKQEKLYRQMESDFVSVDPEDGHEVETPSVLAQLTRMRQLCLDPRLLGFDVRGAKTDALLEWLDDNREPVVIMSMFTSYFKLVKPEIEALGLRVGEIHGEMSNQDKQKTALRFQNGGIDVLLCNIISAGYGFTLDRASTVVFLDKAWNPPENEQAEDRITPVEQSRVHKHAIISLVCKDSYDQRLDEILTSKRSLTDVINEGGREAIIRLLKGESK